MTFQLRCERRLRRGDIRSLFRVGLGVPGPAPRPLGTDFGLGYTVPQGWRNWSRWESPVPHARQVWRDISVKLRTAVLWRTNGVPQVSVGSLSLRRIGLSYSASILLVEQQFECFLFRLYEA
jgi:hypothetical protein